MSEKRQFHRITYVVGGILQCRDATVRCRIENLSQKGVLVTIRDVAIPDIRTGDTCLLQLYHEIEGRYITVETMITHHVFAFVGLAFFNLDPETKISLQSLMEREKRRTLDMDHAVVYCSPYRNAERHSHSL